MEIVLVTAEGGGDDGGESGGASGGMLDAAAATAAERGLADIAVRQAPAQALPFAAGSFDAVLCRLAAHHRQDLEAGLREARRVMKPGGRAVSWTVTRRPSSRRGTPRTSAATARRT